MTLEKKVLRDHGWEREEEWVTRGEEGEGDFQVEGAEVGGEALEGGMVQVFVVIVEGEEDHLKVGEEDHPKVGGEDHLKVGGEDHPEVEGEVEGGEEEDESDLNCKIFILILSNQVQLNKMNFPDSQKQCPVSSSLGSPVILISGWHYITAQQ